MMSVYKKYIFLLTYFFLFPVSSYSYGLRFKGSNYPIDKRTSYRVFDKKVPVYNDYFDVQFDMALYPAVEIGYIVDIRGDYNEQAFNLFFDIRGEDVLFRLNQEGKSVLIALPVNKEDMTKNHWFKVKIAFDLKHNEVTLKIHNREKTCSGVYLSNSFKPSIVFGRSEHIIDIPSFAINSLSVNGDKKYIFPLNEAEGESVYDSVGKSYGKVENPEWLINEAFHWKKEYIFSSSSEAGSCYDENNSIIYYFNRDSIFSYNIENRSYEVKKTNGSCPMKLFLASGFFDPVNEKLYVYEVYHEPPYDNNPSIVSLDLKTLEWKIEGMHHLDMQLHHHDSYYDVQNGSYTIFGGFGNMYYSNRFYNLRTGVRDSSLNLKWNEITGLSGDRICPRYFSSVGYSPENNSIYIFGGMGNETGEQIVGKRYLHDLYRVNLKDNQINKLWELNGEPNIVPAHGMTILADSVFYVLQYRESVSRSHLHLYKFSINDGIYNVLGDSIPIISDKITTNAHLYYNERRKRFFATVQESFDDISSTFTIYSLLYPPVSYSTYEKVKSRNNLPYTLIGGALGIVCVFGLGYIIRNKRKPKKYLNKESCIDELKSSKSVVKKEIEEKEARRTNAVYIFGNFTVYDNKGRDISYMFSLQIKQCFFLILYYSSFEGISSKELSDRLWPDKPKDKVKNSRGVALNHLRSLLNELDGIMLVYEKGFFKFVLSDTFYCDYLRCMELISNKLENPFREEFIKIISRGKFMTFLDNPLFDHFKDDVECKLEVVILEQMRSAFNNNDYHMTINFAKSEFNIDPINEEALSCCIKSYFNLKRENLAIVEYQRFMAEYLKGTGEEYPRPFTDFWC